MLLNQSMPSSLLILTGLIIAGLFSLVVYLLYRQSKLTRSSDEKQNIFLTMQQRLDHLQNQLRLNLDGNTQLLTQQMGLLTKQLDERLNNNLKSSLETDRQIHERMDNAAKVFSALQNKLGELTEANEKIFNVGKDILGLQEILKNPKARGSVGELFLENLLSEMLPRDCFELQFGFKNNEKVDAVIKLGDRLICIDSKFPLENFKRLVSTKEENEKKVFKKQFIGDVKKHIDSISKKYILPSEGTFDFAFMYIPAENVFYEVIIRDDYLDQEESLHSYSLKKRIIPVSPNSFYAYLGALMHALRGQRVQENVHDMINQMRHLSLELGRFKEDFEKIGYHLNHLQTSYEAGEKRLNRYEERLIKIHEPENGLEEKPVKLISG